MKGIQQILFLQYELYDQLVTLASMWFELFIDLLN